MWHGYLSGWRGGPQEVTIDMSDPRRIEAAASSEVIRLAVAYNDALDRCTQTGGANIDDVMAFFADDAVRIVVGPGEDGSTVAQAGKAAIRDGFLRRADRLQQVVELKGIEMCGDWVVCRRERRDTTYPEGAVDNNLRILLVKNGKIKQLIVLIDPEERAHLRQTP
jgi:hypothetical protein